MEVSGFLGNKHRVSMEGSNLLVSWLITYLAGLQPTYIGVWSYDPVTKYYGHPNRNTIIAVNQSMVCDLASRHSRLMSSHSFILEYLKYISQCWWYLQI